MRKTMMGTLVVSLTILLAACSSSAYKESMKNGQKALDEKNYEVAISHFETALKEDSQSNEAKMKIGETKTTYFDSLYEAGTKALDKKAFSEAKELFTKAYDIDPVKQPDLLDKKTKAEELEVKQKQLDEYSKWLEDAKKMNGTLAEQWRVASTDLSFGKVQLKEFNEKIQQTLTTSQNLLKTAEDEILNISGELSNAHTQYLKKLKGNYDQLVLVVLEANKEKAETEKILAVGKELNNILENQGLHIQTLKTYAQNNGIEFDGK